MDATTSSLILSEIQAMRKDVIATLQKQAALDAKIAFLFSNGQPGWINKTSDRLTALEKEDARRTWIERIVTIGISIAVSGIVAMHDHLLRWVGAK